ncbi:MAG: DUF1343 domain-containing protein [Bacteroidales bacterium]|nr:DUF1343 domain-containing protein [Bacteroidales bacterium]
MISDYYKAIVICAVMISGSCHSKHGNTQGTVSGELRLANISEIRTGAERTDLYFPQLKGKTIGIICNQTSLVGNTNLADTLINAGFFVKVIFSPEHGFRGDSDAGADISDGLDKKTGIKIISIYGNKKKPEPEDLEGIDILLFDIQDVGVRFYTYISTLTLVMEAAADKGIPLIVTDRPNPNGFYVDGQVLDTSFRSFVGMHPIPVVYGMTIGEYALMVNGEGWLGERKCDLNVIPLEGYSHNMIVKLPVSPSPNLPTWESVYLYPSLCLFEGTMISVGRGTWTPFQVIGHPHFVIGSYLFKPESIPGVSEHPPYEGQYCLGLGLTDFAENFRENEHHFSLVWLIRMHEFFKDSADFFTPYFDKLAGNDLLRKAIINDLPETEIRKSWENDLNAFRQIRKKYLLYPD